MADDILMARIYLSEKEQGKRKTLMQEILTLLQDRHAVKGVVVFRGIAGFGAGGEVHASDLLRLDVDLPLVIEFFDETKVVEAAVAMLGDRVPGGHIVMWRAQRIGAAAPPARRS